MSGLCHDFDPDFLFYLESMSVLSLLAGRPVYVPLTLQMGVFHRTNGRVNFDHHEPIQSAHFTPHVVKPT